MLVGMCGTLILNSYLKYNSIICTYYYVGTKTNTEH